MAKQTPQTLSNNNQQSIKQVPITKSKKALGLLSNAAGNYQDQVNAWIDAIQTWTGRLDRGRLPAKWVWVSYGQQLWVNLRYGMGTNGSPVDKLCGLEEQIEDREDIDNGGKKDRQR